LLVSSIYQDARDVKPKFSKTFLTVFFAVGNEVRQIVEEWISLGSEKGWGPEDPLFPATEVKPGAGHAFEPNGLNLDAAAAGRSGISTTFSASGWLAS
jgi:integrase/recombinase XerD